MLIFNRQQIAQQIDLKSAALAIEQAYRDYSSGKINQPPVGHTAFPANGGDCQPDMLDVLLAIQLQPTFSLSG